jgi:hypothetical protein
LGKESSLDLPGHAEGAQYLHLPGLQGDLKDGQLNFTHPDPKVLRGFVLFTMKMQIPQEGR